MTITFLLNGVSRTGTVIRQLLLGEYLVQLTDGIDDQQLAICAPFIPHTLT